MTGLIATCAGGYVAAINAECPREDQPMDYKPVDRSDGTRLNLWQCPGCLNWRMYPDDPE